MKLRVGIAGGAGTAWGALLSQIGVPCASARLLSAEEWSAVVVDDAADEAAIDEARRYLAGGGSVLCSGRVHARLTGAAAHECSIRYLLQDEPEGRFPGIGLVDLGAPCTVPHGANAVRSSDGRMSVFAGEFGGGRIVALPFDAPSLLGDMRAVPKSFWTGQRKLPHERVALVSRAGIRKLVARGLELLHHERGLPFLHLWHFPGEERSLFAFRIDTDFAGRAEAESLLALLSRHRMSATWFVHVAGQEELLPLYKAMDGHEIGIHCFEHRAFSEAPEIESDLAKSTAALAAAGIPYAGYAGPYGRWSPALSEAVARQGFEYASEFSYDYDNLPSFPPSGAAGEGALLQMPVHPISVGNLRRQGCSVDVMLRYFLETAERALGAGDPLFFYHHPKNLHHEVLDGLFSFVRERGIRPVRLGEYARWWKRRTSTRVEAELAGPSLVLSGGAPGSDIRCRLTRGDGMEAFVDAAGRADLGALSWSESVKALPLPAGIRRIRSFNPWITINRLEDAVRRALAR